MEQTRAPWIQFLDSDDLLLPDKFEHQLKFAAAAPPDVATVYSEWQPYCLEGEWIAKPPIFALNLEGDLNLNLLRTDGFVHTGCQLFRTAWLEQVNGFDENCWLIEDVHLNLRLAMSGGRFLFSPAGRALFYYRRRGPHPSRGVAGWIS